MRRASCALVLAACGRVAYDPLAGQDGAPGTDGAAETDGTLGTDGALVPDGPGPDGVAGTCGAGTISSCARPTTFVIAVTSRGTIADNLSAFTDSTTGPCGGAGGPDSGLVFRASENGTYHFELSAAFDTVFYAIDGTSCGGASLACSDQVGSSGEVLDIPLTLGQEIVVVADSRGTCGPVTFRYGTGM